MSTTFTICIAIYVVSIFWCKKTVTYLDRDNKDGYGIFTSEFLILVTSWIPLLNSFLAIISTYEILEDIIIKWVVKREVRKKIQKIANKYKGTPAYDEIMKIVHKI
jgi:hypothetical protein